MYLRTEALDCLYLNWALPLACAPPLPRPLRYEVHNWQGEEWIFASALLFRLSGLHLESLPFLRLSYPQMNVRLYVLDGDGLPSVLFRRMLTPWWVVPLSRFAARQPAAAAFFSYPSPSREPTLATWRWRIGRRKALDVSAHPAEVSEGGGPRLGSWERTVSYFRQRSRGYALWENRLRSVTPFRPAVEVWPLAVDLHDVALLADSLGVECARLETLHSAWLCPVVPFTFELGRPMRVPLAPRRVVATEVPRLAARQSWLC